MTGRMDGPMLVSMSDVEATLVELHAARAEVAKLKAQLRHYEGWFGTECRCDDDDCPL